MGLFKNLFSKPVDNVYAHLYVNSGIADKNITVTVGTYSQTLDFKDNNPR